MPSLVRIAVAAIAFTASPALAAEGRPDAKPAGTSPSSSARQATCGHGVRKSLCARCNPKLAAVYKAKGDWCPEHERPESQCVLCHPELAKKGVK
ncbi:MAG TPA: hypothetical protein VLS93_07205 [Anaeromyxobacteraceae bacterium]|nr:hypothetical protein [Anaeromyxobacteraceae bacterium]